MSQHFLKSMALCAALTGVCFSVAGPAAAAGARKCQPDTIVGTWHRFDDAGKAIGAVWTFRADMTLGCKGNCARAAGMPLSYTLERGKTTLRFERGSMSKSTCRIKGNTMFLGGGAAKGGFTFARE